MKTGTRIITLLSLTLVALVLAGPATVQAQDLYRVTMSAPGASTYSNPQGRLASVADTSAF